MPYSEGLPSFPHFEAGTDIGYLLRNTFPGPPTLLPWRVTDSIGRVSRLFGCRSSVCYAPLDSNLRRNNLNVKVVVLAVDDVTNASSHQPIKRNVRQSSGANHRILSDKGDGTVLVVSHGPALCIYHYHSAICNSSLVPCPAREE